jgi:hypothetical protein
LKRVPRTPGQLRISELLHVASAALERDHWTRKTDNTSKVPAENCGTERGVRGNA